MRSPLLLLLLSGCVLSGCVAHGQAGLLADSRSKNQRVPPTTLPSAEPILQFWNDGVYLLNIKASPEFILWEDGTMLRRLPNQSYYHAHLNQRQVDKLMAKLWEAGCFDPPYWEFHVAPDAGSHTLSARMNGVSVLFSYDHGYDSREAMEQIGPSASPSREQVQTFTRRWYAAENAIRAVTPDHLDRLEWHPNLQYPTTRTTATLDQ